MAAKLTLAERLRIQNPASPLLYKNLALVLSLRDEIEVALGDGWSRKAIWKLLRDEKTLDVGYHSFLNYLRRIKAAEPTGPDSNRTARSTGTRGFAFSATPKKDLT